MTMITYEIKTIFKIIWNKKGVVLLIGLLFGLMSVPISNLSYEKSLENYERISSLSYNKKNQGTGEAFILVKKDIEKENIITDISKIIQSQIITSRTIEELSGKSQLLIKGISLIPLESMDTIIVRGKDISKDKFRVIIDALIEENNLFFKKIFPNEEIYLEVIKENYTEPKVKSNEFLFKPPTKKQNQIKVIGTATLFGILIGCTLILVRDFRSRCSGKEIVK